MPNGSSSPAFPFTVVCFDRPSPKSNSSAYLLVFISDSCEQCRPVDGSACLGLRPVRGYTIVGHGL